MQDIQCSETDASVAEVSVPEKNSLPCQHMVELHISALKWVSEEVVEITSSEGTSFFMRLSYLQLVPPDAVVLGACFVNEQVEDVLCAASAFLAERLAMGYVLRREHSVFQLECKLKKKGFADDSIALVLSLLRQKNYVCDSRFAAAWLRNRSISHSEGPVRLNRELLMRGVSKIDAQNAVAEFFENLDEDVVFARAVQKELRRSSDFKKITQKLQRRGFPFSYISKNIQKYINNLQ